MENSSPIPSKLNLFKKALEFGISNVWRNKILSLATIFVVGIIIFIFNIILAVNFIATDAISDLSKKIDITIYLKDSSTKNQIENIANEVGKLPGIENITFTSKEDALNELKTTHPDLAIAFEKYQLGNPLPASLNITTIHPKYHSAINTLLSQDRHQIHLSNLVSNKGENNDILNSVSQNLLKVSSFTHQLIFWLITIFIIGGALIILNAVQITIFTRRKEIEVMKLVGSSYWFIRLPFIIESIIYSILAVILSFFMLLVISQKLALEQTSYLIFFLEIIAAIVLSALSSLVAVHEHLLKK